MIDEFGTPRAFQLNVDREYERNIERYQFLKWGQSAFDNFRVVPPGTGICHQVNLEYLAQTVWTDKDLTGALVAYPDTLVGTDSHTTMVNGLAVLGWGVGGIEAEAAMLGQPVSMLIPEVVGFKLTGRMVEGTTATDLVLKVVQMLRKKGVVNKFVEFYGEGLDHLPLADRATIGNMAPEYGATCGFFPIDGETLRYLRQTGPRRGRGSRWSRPMPRRTACGAGRTTSRSTPTRCTSTWARSSRRSPGRSGRRTTRRSTRRPTPSTRRSPTTAASTSRTAPRRWAPRAGRWPSRRRRRSAGRREVEGEDYTIRDGSVVIAAITSCTNTSNPYVMIGAGLVARKARALGLTRKPWVKTSLAPGSQVVSGYLEAAGLQEDLDAIGFNLAGYGCTTCIGNSGPLRRPEISKAIADNDLVATAVLSGNRNFEGRISPDVRANYLASPPLVVAYAIAGDVNIDLTVDPIGVGKDGKRRLSRRTSGRPTTRSRDLVEQTVTREAFQSKYADVFKGDEKWQAVETADSETYNWPPTSTYIQNPPYFQGMAKDPGVISDITGARILALLGDMVTTDHISPGRVVQVDDARRRVPDRAADPDEGLQLLRLAARQPRGDDARHLRQHPHQERDAGRGRGRLQPRAGRRADVDLRRRDGLPGRGGAAGGDRRRRVWRGVVARLGGEGDRAPRGEGGDRRELRAHPPLEPRRHGRDPVRVHRRRQPQDAGAEGRRGDLDLGARGRPQAAGRSCPAPSSMPTGGERTIQLKCRIDTAIEIEYVEHGGVLHYVLRNLAKAA